MELNALSILTGITAHCETHSERMLLLGIRNFWLEVIPHKIGCKQTLNDALNLLPAQFVSFLSALPEKELDVEGEGLNCHS